MKTTRRGFFGFFAGVAALSPFAAKTRRDLLEQGVTLHDVIYDVSPTETPFLKAARLNQEVSSRVHVWQDDLLK